MRPKFENLLKSYFITALTTYSLVVTAIGVYNLNLGTHFGIWVSVTASAAQIGVYFARLYLAHVPRTTPGLAGFSVGIFAATMYSVYTSYSAQIASPAPLLALVSLAGWLGYVSWYSELGDRSKDKVKLGKRLPKILLENYDGIEMSSDDWRGEKRLVIFYRGNWCPICTAQVIELTNFEREFEALGVKITLVSPQSHEKSRKHANQVGMKFDFLVDVNNRAAKTLGILQTDGVPKGFEILGFEADVPKPTTFIINETGKVIYADLTTNYRLRPKPEDMLKVLQK